MSVYRSFRLNCACGHEFDALLWDSINVTEQQELKSRLLNGEINQIQCEKCKKRSYIEKHLLYHDVDKKLWVQMFPRSDRSKWQELEEEHKEDLKKNSISKKYFFRLAFGQDELLEKVRIFDNGLDDRILELLKLKILEQDEAMKDISDAELTFSQYHVEDGEIHFKMASLEKNLSQTLVIPFEHYEEIEESQEHVSGENPATQTVCHGMYVSVNKTRVFH